jgi:AcrR family transcriptional regulator
VTLPARIAADPWRDPLAVAMVDLCAERSYERVDVEDLLERSGLSAAEFSRRFIDKEDCAMEVLEAFVEDFETRIRSVFESHEEWRTALRATAYECADWAEEHPNLLRFGTVEILAAKSEMMRVRREEAFQFCAELIEAGRAAAPDPDSVSQAASMVAIGSIMNLVALRLQRGEELRVHESVPEMMYAAVRPYLGEEAAREELSLPRPDASA